MNMHHNITLRKYPYLSMSLTRQSYRIEKNLKQIFNNSKIDPISVNELTLAIFSRIIISIKIKDSF